MADTSFKALVMLYIIKLYAQINVLKFIFPNKGFL